MPWDDRLLTAARAQQLGGAWPLTATAELAELSQFEMEDGTDPLRDQWQVNLRCATVKGWKYDNTAAANDALPRAACGQSVTLLAAAGQSYTTNPDEILQATIRHQVMAHNLSLSAAPQ